MTADSFRRIMASLNSALAFAEGKPPEGTRTHVHETDFAKVDAYENTAADYEEIPEITDEMIARGLPGDGRELLKRGRF